MKKVGWRFAQFFLIVIIILAAFAPPVESQNLGTTVQVLAVPEGPLFTVDGMSYRQPMSAVWPTGSKHVLSVANHVQTSGSGIRWTFSGWFAGSLALPGGDTVVVTADPSISNVIARFGNEYALHLNFNPCGDAISCPSPGTIYVNGAAYLFDQDVYIAAGGNATLIAVPNPGYVFVGWEPGPGQQISGTTDTVTM